MTGYCQQCGEQETFNQLRRSTPQKPDVLEARLHFGVDYVVEFACGHRTVLITARAQ
jgi:hypothetical protein